MREELKPVNAIEDMRKTLSHIVFCCQVMATLPTIWMRIPGTIGKNHFKFPALVWWFSFPLQIEAAYVYVTKGIVSYGALDYMIAMYFWYASTAMLLVHRIATAIRGRRG